MVRNCGSIGARAFLECRHDVRVGRKSKIIAAAEVRKPPTALENERSIDLLPASATLVGIDKATALVLADGGWRVAGAGSVSVYDGRSSTAYEHGSRIESLPV